MRSGSAADRGGRGGLGGEVSSTRSVTSPWQRQNDDVAVELATWQ